MRTAHSTILSCSWSFRFIRLEHHVPFSKHISCGFLKNFSTFHLENVDFTLECSSDILGNCFPIPSNTTACPIPCLALFLFCNHLSLLMMIFNGPISSCLECEPIGSFVTVEKWVPTNTLHWLKYLHNFNNGTLPSWTPSATSISLMFSAIFHPSCIQFVKYSPFPVSLVCPSLCLAPLLLPAPHLFAYHGTLSLPLLSTWPHLKQSWRCLNNTEDL